MEYFMIKTFNKFRINFTTAFLLMMSSFFYLVSCNDTVDDLWDDTNPRDDYSPVIGDWYADSIKAYYSCVKTADSTSDVMSNSYIDNYNLWLLSDGSLQLYFDQTVNLKNECEYNYGTWNNSTGCSDFYYYYDYYNYSPLEFCSNYYEHNQYNIETTSCDQSASINGSWIVDENTSTVTIKMDSVCLNSYGNPSYITSPDLCSGLEYGEFFNSIEKVFTYSVNKDSGRIDLDGSWFGDDSSCVTIHMSLE